MGSTNPKKTFLIARVYGALPWQPNFGQNRPKKITKMAITSVVSDISLAEIDFEIAFVPSGNSPVTLPCTRDKGALPWQPILGLKLL